LGHIHSAFRLYNKNISIRLCKPSNHPMEARACWCCKKEAWTEKSV